jgi:C4-dicarboxylate-specific signal transduction histidine kinase
LIAISDSGPGIPEEKLAAIFDPFFTSKQQGMGIGLSIARTIVQAPGEDLGGEPSGRRRGVLSVDTSCVGDPVARDSSCR